MFNTSITQLIDHIAPIGDIQIPACKCIGRIAAGQLVILIEVTTSIIADCCISKQLISWPFKKAALVGEHSIRMSFICDYDALIGVFL